MKQELMNTEIELINEDEAFQLGGVFSVFLLNINTGFCV